MWRRGGTDDEVDAGVEVVGGETDASVGAGTVGGVRGWGVDAAVDEVTAVVGDHTVTGGGSTATGDRGVGRTEGD